MPNPSLIERITQRQSGICLYGFAPPKRSTSAEQLAQIARQQCERLVALDIDGVIVYDIQDEARSHRRAASVPFPADGLPGAVRA